MISHMETVWKSENDKELIDLTPVPASSLQTRKRKYVYTEKANSCEKQKNKWSSDFPWEKINMHTNLSFQISRKPFWFPWHQKKKSNFILHSTSSTRPVNATRASVTGTIISFRYQTTLGFHAQAPVTILSQYSKGMLEFSEMTSDSSMVVRDVGLCNLEKSAEINREVHTYSFVQYLLETSDCAERCSQCHSHHSSRMTVDVHFLLTKWGKRLSKTLCSGGETFELWREQPNAKVRGHDPLIFLQCNRAQLWSCGKADGCRLPSSQWSEVRYCVC